MIETELRSVDPLAAEIERISTILDDEFYDTVFSECKYEGI